MYEMTTEEIHRHKLLKGVKEELKVIARNIRSDKALRKPFALKASGDLRHAWTIESHIARNRDSFRVLHIAYCEFRGRTRAEIEKPRIDVNGFPRWLNERKIKDYKKSWTKHIGTMCRMEELGKIAETKAGAGIVVVHHSE